MTSTRPIARHARASLALVLAVSLLAIATAPRLLAQAPHADWRTINTPHFRIHYPQPYEEWASLVARRIEPIRDAVVGQVGFDPPQRTAVIVTNPEAQTNGLTFPLLDTPRIVLYTEPPGPDIQIGEFGDWIDLLVTHEVTHLIHLLRPSRNPTQRLIAQFLPVSPIALSAPRWVLEGYATVIEGRLTGSGRPSSTMRALILRKWAQNGRMPSYEQLQSDRRFLGMSMAYLAGSAFLEWLEERSGPDALQRLWARLTARENRGFARAFEGVFGDSPGRLYGVFVAELTERAVNVDRESRRELREGTLWQETTRNSGDPDVSPDGKQIAMVLRSESAPSKLVIWSTGEASEEETRAQKRLGRILRRDPEDVPHVRMKPLPRKPVHSLSMPDGGDIETPRWMPDGKAILFVHRERDRDGMRHRDLFVWTPPAGVERVTHLADVSDADPMPDGRSAVAVRSRNGGSELVTVDLRSGGATSLTEASVERIYSHPRVSGDGTRVAYAVHDGGRWQLAVRALATGSETLTPIEGANVATPEWSRSGSGLFATVLARGFAELQAIEPGEDGAAVTRMSGGAFQPAPSPDGRLFFMSLEPDGAVLRLLENVAPAPPRAAIARSLVPALPPVPALATVFKDAPVAASRLYGVGRQELGWIISGNSAPAAHTTELGVHASDVIGRLDTLAVASLGKRSSQRGATIASAWRGWPVEVGAQLFGVEEPQFEQRGLDLHAGRTIHLNNVVRASAETRVLVSRGRDAPEDWRSRNIVSILAGTTAQTERSGGSVEVGASTGALKYVRAAIRGGAKLGALRLNGEVRRDQARSVTRLSDAVLVGGVATTVMSPSSLFNRVLEPALPMAALAGRSYTGAGVSAGLGPVQLFYRRHAVAERLAIGGAASLDLLRLAGLEVAMRSGPVPIAKFPGFDLTLGAARILDGIEKGRTRWWVAIRLEP